LTLKPSGFCNVGVNSIFLGFEPLNLGVVKKERINV